MTLADAVLSQCEDRRKDRTMQILLVYDSTPDDARVQADAAQVLRDHQARRSDARGREAIRAVLIARLCNTLQLHALAGSAREVNL